MSKFSKTNIEEVNLPHTQVHVGVDERISSVLAASHENTKQILAGQNKLTAAGTVDLSVVTTAIASIQAKVDENNTILKDLQSKV